MCSKENILILNNVKNQLNLNKISKVEQKFLGNPTFPNFVYLYEYMNKKVNSLNFNSESLNTNKQFIIFLTNDNQTITYYNNVFVTKKQNVPQNNNENLSNRLSFINRLYNDYINNTNNQYIIPDIVSSKLQKIIRKKKPYHWKRYSSNSWDYMSSYTPSTINIGISDQLTFIFNAEYVYGQPSTVAGPEIHVETLSYNRNGYNIIVFPPLQGSIAFTRLPSSDIVINFLCVANGGESSFNQVSDGVYNIAGGGGGGYIYINDTSFNSYLTSNIRKPLPISVASYTTNVNNSVLGTYMSYAGGNASLDASQGGIGGGNNQGVSNNGGNGGSISSTSQNSNIVKIPIPIYQEGTYSNIYVSGGAAGGANLTAFKVASGGIGTGGEIIDVSNYSSQTSTTLSNGSYLSNSFGGGAGAYLYAQTFSPPSLGVPGDGAIILWWKNT